MMNPVKTSRLEVPEPLAASLGTHFGAAGRAWVAALPALAADHLDRWDLRPDGPPDHGTVALVLPVCRADGTPAALKLQPVNEESRDEPVALQTWGGHGAVRLLAVGADPSSMLLERLDPGRALARVRDEQSAVQILVELLARLTAVPAPKGLRRLADIAAGMVHQVPRALRQLSDPAERRQVQTWAGMVEEMLPEAGDRLLHWDLHYDNILAPYDAERREPWLAIDPNPLAGDPCFELLPALHNRWDEMVATGDLTRALRRRFDQMTEVLGLERQRATGWTVGRVLQNVLWDVEAGQTRLQPGAREVVRAVGGEPS